MKNCPYCGRRISYFTVFHEKKHGSYKCSRCKKESKIKTDMRLLAAFAAVALAVIIFLIIWYTNESLRNNIFGFIITAAVLLIFYFMTPVFVRFVPLKKYMDEEEDKSDYTPETTSPFDGYTFNRAAFDEIKRRRSERRPEKTSEDKENLVPVIKDVSSSHGSSDAPLKKVTRPKKELKHEQAEETSEEEVKTYVPKTKKPDGSTYTANRKL